MKILVNSNIRDFDSKGMSLSAKAGAARPQERGRHAISKFRTAVKVKIMRNFDVLLINNSDSLIMEIA